MKTITINNVSVEVTKEQLQEALDEFDKPEFDYPICCKTKTTGLVMLFSSDKEAVVLKADKDNYHTVGEVCKVWGHTDKSIWKEIPYDKERGLYHKQLVYCWDNVDTHSVDIRFYDAKYRCPFTYNGESEGHKFTNYSALLPEHMKEFKKK